MMSLAGLDSKKPTHPNHPISKCQIEAKSTDGQGKALMFPPFPKWQ